MTARREGQEMLIDDLPVKGLGYRELAGGVDGQTLPFRTDVTTDRTMMTQAASRHS